MTVFLVRSDLKRQKIKYLENIWEVKWDNNRKTNKQKQSKLFTEATICLFLFLVNRAVVTFFKQPPLHTAAPASGYEEESKQVHFYMLCGGWIPRIIYAQPENYANWYPHGSVKSKTTQKHKQRKAHPCGVGAFCLYWTIVLGEKKQRNVFFDSSAYMYVYI